VNINAALTLAQRRKILESIIDEHVLSASKILSHLDMLIRRSEGVDMLALARKKWITDRMYVLKNFSGAEVVDVSSIRHKKIIPAE